MKAQLTMHKVQRKCGSIKFNEAGKCFDDEIGFGDGFNYFFFVFEPIASSF